MSTTAATFASLPRYPLCYALSFLTENDGTSALITNRRWSRRVLPLFALRMRPSSSLILAARSAPVDDRQGGGGGGRRRPRVAARHKYAVCPVQDPDTLLCRLNSRRLRKRLVRAAAGTAKRRGGRKATDGEGDDDDDSGSCGRPYELGMTTDELARSEWTAGVESGGRWSWSANLELLRWRDSTTAANVVGVLPMPKARPPGSSRPPRPAQTTLLASYPRSGNTFLRTLLERTLLEVTGSDTRPDRTLSKSLALEHDLVGEGVILPTTPSSDPTLVGGSGSARIVKTHYPERKGCLPYDCHRVILLVRNPYDSIDSYWNLCVTNTHTRTVCQSVYDEYGDKFRDMALSEIKTWCDFHGWWLQTCEERGVACKVVRYEDLVQDVGGTLRDVVGFVLGDGENGDDCGKLDDFWEKRVRHVLCEGSGGEQTRGAAGSCTSGLGSYRPRDHDGPAAASGGASGPHQGEAGDEQDDDEPHVADLVPPSIGKSLRRRRYSDQTLRRMHDVVASLSEPETDSDGDGGGGGGGSETTTKMLRRFGYDIYYQGFPRNFARDASGGGGGEDSVDDDDGADNVVSAVGAGVEASLYELCTGNGTHTKKGQDESNGPQSPAPPRPSIRVNAGQEIRSPVDPYGRAMTAWRKGKTEQDTKPFPTVSR